MDSFDVKILNIIQRDNCLPAEKIADQVGISPSAVQRRLKRLRENGIIEAEVAIISPETAGAQAYRHCCGDASAGASMSLV